MEKYFKEQLRWLKDREHYDPDNATDRQSNHDLHISWQHAPLPCFLFLSSPSLSLSLPAGDSGLFADHVHTHVDHEDFIWRL